MKAAGVPETKSSLVLEEKEGIYDVVTITNALRDEIEPGAIKWDNKDIIKKLWKPGEVRAFPQFEADHITEKMIDYYIIHETKEGIKNVNVMAMRDKFREQIQGIKKEVDKTSNIEDLKEVSAKPFKKDEQSVEAVNLEDLKMPELKKLGKGLGIKLKFAERKADLIKKIQHAKQHAKQQAE